MLGGNFPFQNSILYFPVVQDFKGADIKHPVVQFKIKLPPIMFDKIPVVMDEFPANIAGSFSKRTHQMQSDLAQLSADDFPVIELFDKIIAVCRKLGPPVVDFFAFAPKPQFNIMLYSAFVISQSLKVEIGHLSPLLLK